MERLTLDEDAVHEFLNGLRVIAKKLENEETTTKVSFLNIVKALSELKTGAFPLYWLELIRTFFDESVEMTRAIPYERSMSEFFDNFIGVIANSFEKELKTNPIGQILQMISENIRIESTLQKLKDKNIRVKVSSLAELTPIEDLKALGFAKKRSRNDIRRILTVKVSDKSTFEEIMTQEGIQFVLASSNGKEIEYQMITELKASSGLKYLGESPDQITKYVDDLFRTQIKGHIQMIQLKSKDPQQLLFFFKQTLQTGEMQYRLGLNFGHFPLDNSLEYTDKLNAFKFGTSGISELNDASQLTSQSKLAEKLLSELTNTERDQKTKALIKDIVDGLDVDKTTKNEITSILVQEFNHFVSEAKSSPQSFIKVIM